MCGVKKYRKIVGEVWHNLPSDVTDVLSSAGRIDRISFERLLHRNLGSMRRAKRGLAGCCGINHEALALGGDAERHMDGAAYLGSSKRNKKPGIFGQTKILS